MRRPTAGTNPRVSWVVRYSNVDRSTSMRRSVVRVQTTLLTQLTDMRKGKLKSCGLGEPFPEGAIRKMQRDMTNFSPLFQK